MMSRIPTQDQDKYILRMPDGMRDRLKKEAEANARSLNAEITSRLAFSLQAHPHAYLIRAMLDMREDLLKGKEELNIPHQLQDEIRRIAETQGVSAQRYLTHLVLEAINNLDEQTALGKKLQKAVSTALESD